MRWEESHGRQKTLIPRELVSVSLWYLCAKSSTLQRSLRLVPSEACSLSAEPVRMQGREGCSVLSVIPCHCHLGRLLTLTEGL